MRVLLLHCDYLQFQATKKALKDPEEIVDKEGRLEECVACFMAVEKEDEKDPDKAAQLVADSVFDMASKVGAQNAVLYPYAHLSNELSTPKTAQKVLDKAYEIVSTKHKSVKAPFGWYKSFELKCKGHPLSELSRTLSVESEEKKDESEALSGEDKIESTWYIMDVEGHLHEPGEFDYAGHERLEKFAGYEKQKSRVADKTPPHIQLMRRLELADYEPASDPGNMRYYPKGRMMKALLEQYVTDNILEYGGLEVETPIMYDFEHPTLAKYLNRFPARQYSIESDDRRFFLRFAACFGQFLMAHDATLSYRSLPLRLYELARYAFRREKSGELTGLRRLRAFTMPDVHALCTGFEQAMKEYRRRFRLSIETVEGVGLQRDDVELAVRVTRSFYEENKEFVTELVKEFGKPALIEMWDERIFYFVLKYEFNFVDALDKASALSTDQIDVENGQRYEIEYTGADGVQKNPVILHCSPSGAIERVIYALLEKAHMQSLKGVAPSLPLWLSPTQVRIIPVSENFIEKADQIANQLSQQKIRADVDDRNMSMGKKIRQAEKEWTPYVAVIGEREAESGKLTIRVRGEKEQRQMDAEGLTETVKHQTRDKPYRPLPLPRHLSQRPAFVG